MGWGTQGRKLLAISSLFAMVVLFQQCSVQSPVSYESTGKLSGPLASENNGDGYFGRPTDGDYVRSDEGYACRDNPTQNLQGKINVASNSMTIVDDNCVDYSYPIDETSSLFNFQPYNQDYFTFDRSVYERQTVFEGEQTRALEAFCRSTDQNSGIDVVVKYNGADSASAKMYLGARVNSNWNSRLVPMFSVRRSSGSALEYSNSTFRIRITASSMSGVPFQGRLSTMIDGNQVDRTMACRLMSRQSVFTNGNLGLAGLFQFNNDVLDYSGNGLVAALNGGSTTMQYRAGYYDQSLGFDGVDDTVRVTPHPAINNVRAITITAWIRPRGWGAIAAKADQTLLTRGWKFGIGGGTDRLYFRYAFSGLHLYSDQSADVIDRSGVWQHVAVSWDGTPTYANVNFYFNGVPLGYSSYQGPTGSPLDDSPYPLEIGGKSDLPSDPTFEGEIDQVTIWRRALSPAEIQNIYQTGTPVP